MINYETILSSYDDKLTLMQWLKKVEDALKNASLSSVTIAQPADNQAILTFVFADGTSVSSPSLNLPRGPQGEQGAQGVGVSKVIINSDSHLIVVLTNGARIDAGAIFTGNVTLTGDLTAVGVHATGTGVKTSVISQDVSSGIDVFASVVSLNNRLQAQGSIASDTSIKTPVLTSDEDEISAQKPVVEVMTGYSFTASSAEKWSPVYVGACKNGNKITFVIFGSYTFTTGDTELAFGNLNISPSVGAKLYPYTRGTMANILSQDGVGLYVDDTYNAAAKIALFELVKASNSLLVLNVRGLGEAALENGKTYIFRYERTFLLSENLAA